MSTPGTIVIGTTSINFVQIAGPGTYTANAPLSLNGTQFNLNTTGTAATYGNSAYIPVLTTDAYGRVSAVTNTAISIPISQVIGLQSQQDSQNTSITAAFNKANTGAPLSGYLANSVIFANNTGYLSNTSNFTYDATSNTLTTGNITGSDTTSMVIQSKVPSLGSSPTLTIQTPNSQNGSYAPASLTIKAGSVYGSGVSRGGNVTISAGAGGVNGGGNLTLNSGNANGGFPGNIYLNPGYGNGLYGTAQINGDTYAGTARAYINTTTNIGDGSSLVSLTGDKLLITSPRVEFPSTTSICTPDVQVNSGSINIFTGASSAATSGLVSGSVNITTGISDYIGGITGDIRITTGTAGNPDGGNALRAGSVYITGGDDVGGYGTAGSIYLKSGDTLATKGIIDLSTAAGTTVKLAAVGGVRQLGFYGVTPIAKPAPTASGTGSVLSSIASSLNSLGLISNTSLTNITSTDTLAQSAYDKANTAANSVIQNAQSTTYSLTTSDAGKYVYYTQSANVTLYIPNSGSVPFINGSTIMVVSKTSSSANVTITPNTGVSLYLVGNTTSQSRNVTTYGMATLFMAEANTWFINGTGVV
jgi:hypothetical protein